MQQKKFAFIEYRISYLLLLLLGVINTTTAQLSVDEVTEKLWKGLGGRQNWEESRYFMFSSTPVQEDFTMGEQVYLWDRESGKCRLDSKLADGRPLTILFNTQQDAARIYVDGKLAKDQENTVALQQKNRTAFQHSAFWFFIPERIEQASAIREAGQELADGKRYDVLLISGAPRTSGIRTSKFYVDTQSGKIERWVALDDHGTTVCDYRLSQFKDIGGGLILPTQFTDLHQQDGITYTIASSLMDVETEKFTKP